MKYVISKQDKDIFYEMMNRFYYLKKRYGKNIIKLIKIEMKRRDKDEEKFNNFLRKKIKENFNKNIGTQILKLL